MNARLSTPVRVCCHCHQPKPLTAEHFSPRSELSRRDEFIAVCRPCKNERDRLRTQEKRRQRVENGEPRVVTEKVRPEAPVGTPKRICVVCLTPKPLTNSYFGIRRYPNGAVAFRSTCHACRNAGAKWNPKGERVYESIEKICGLCCSMPHRVVGPTCRVCSLAYGEDSKPELVTSTYFDPRSGW
jgi:hypothetical protein